MLITKAIENRNIAIPKKYLTLKGNSILLTVKYVVTYKVINPIA
jgi:hypothetical protein